MFDFPMRELLDHRVALMWLERHLHPDGLHGPRCTSTARRLCRAQGHFPAYRGRACHGYSTLLTGTVFANTRQRPATLVLLQQRLQTTLHATAPTAMMMGTACEADECYQNVGKNSTPHRDPHEPPSRRAHQRKGHGTYANDRPPIISLVSRETGEQRSWMSDHGDRWTCHGLIIENLSASSTRLYTDERQSYRESHPAHATVRHGVHEWAQDDDGDDRREIHCHTCEGAGAALRTYLRVFRGVHKRYLHLYVATYEAMVHATRVTPDLIQRMCVADLSEHIGYT